MDNNEKVGKFIKQLREKSGMSQNEVADKMYVSRQAVSNWETGKHLPDFENFKLLAKMFNVNVSELIHGEYIESDKEKENVFIKFISKMNEDKKRTIKYFCIIIVLLLLVFFAYYFVNSYKSLKIFTVSYEQEEFEVNGVLVLSRKDTYLNINVSNLEIDTMELYTTNKDQEEIIMATKNSYIQIREKNGYSEYLNYNIIEKNKDNYHLKIKTKDNKSFVVDLLIRKLSENNNLLFIDKDDAIGKDISENELSIPRKIKETFKYENGVYVLNQTNNEKNIVLIFDSETNVFKVNENDKNSIKIWNYYFKKQTVKYEKYINDEIVETFEASIEDTQNETIKYFVEQYINKYFKE